MNEQASSPSSRAKKFTIHSKQSDFDCYYILSVENMCLSASFNNEMAPFEKTFEQLITYIEQIGIFKIHVLFLAAAACPFQENVQKMKFLNLWPNTEQNGRRGHRSLC